MSGHDALDQRPLLEQALRQIREMRRRLAAAEQARHEPIAVVGAGVRTPGGADDLDSLWELLRSGTDAVTPFVDSVDGVRPGPTDRRAGGPSAGLLPDIDGFDGQFFGISANEADHMDPQQRLVLETAWEAAEDAGIPVDRLQERSTGVFVGVYNSDYLTLQTSGLAEITAYTGPGGAHSIVANRLSYLLDLRGPSLAVDTACSSSLVALHLACRALRAGDCDYALVAGVNIIASPTSTQVTGKVLPMAPGGRCRTFDSDADGIVRAEGAAVLLLERLSDARSGGHRIRSIIRGTAVNHNGRTNGLTAPNPRGQAELVRRALADASADPADVVYVEAHGTGTRLGDPIEVDALRQVYGPGEKPCAIGSVKTNFGHQEAAAGITGLVKAMLVLERGQIPPHVHLNRLNPEIDLDGTRLAVPTELTPLPAGERRLAAVSSFGFGGANAHVVLEEPPSPVEAAASAESRSPADRPAAFVLPLSARSGAALGGLAERYVDRLDGLDDAEAARVCAAAAVRRTHHPVRLAVAAADRDDLVRQLASVRTAHRRPVPPGERRIAFVFSGQGSQWAGMGRDVLATQPVVRAEVVKCDAVVRGLTGWSVIEQLEAPEGASRVHETEIAQVSIGALQLGLAALWRSWGVEPHAVVGHSMGEIIAACVAGALDRDQALELLVQRARLTERGAAGGAMVSVELPAAEVAPLVASAPGRVGIAGLNGPRSTVVSGDVAAVEFVTAAAAARGATTRRVKVSYAFHSPLLDGVTAELAGAVEHLRAGQTGIPLYSTVTGGPIDGADLDVAHWVRNLRAEVRFHPAVAALLDDEVTTFVEVGPHPVLLRDIAQIAEDAGAPAVAVGSLRRNEQASLTLRRSLADLYTAGVTVDWTGVVAPLDRHVPLPAYPWQRQRHWLTLVPGHATGTGGPVAAPVRDTVPHPVQQPTAEPSARTAGELSESLADDVRERIAAALGLTGPGEVPADLPFEALSLGSLMIVELKNQIEREYGIAVPLQPFLEGGTVRGITQVVADAIAAAEAVSA